MVSERWKGPQSRMEINHSIEGRYAGSHYTIKPLRDWSLITGMGGATKREGGRCEVLPLRKGGGRKSFSHAEGGGKKRFGVFFMR